MNRAEREAEMREKYPRMFTHSGLRSGEVWLDDQVIEVVYLNAHSYQQHGMPSARVGDELVMGELRSLPGVQLEFRSIFVDLNELFRAEEEYKKEKSASA